MGCLVDIYGRPVSSFGKSFTSSEVVTGDAEITEYGVYIPVDLTSSSKIGHHIIKLKDITDGKDLIMPIQRIDTDTTKILRISGFNGNYDEDNVFTPLEQLPALDPFTVTQLPINGANEFTVSALGLPVDMSNYLAIGDTVLVNDVDTYTVLSIASSVVTVNEPVALVTNVNIKVAGYFLAESILEEAVQVLYSSKLNKWKHL